MSKKQIDYFNARIPDPNDKPRSEWHHVERRAEILQMMTRKGGPTRMPSQASLAELYDKHPSTISRDFDEIAECVDMALGGDIGQRIESGFRAIFDALMEEGEYEKAWRVLDGYERLCERRGAIPRVPDKLDVTSREAATESASYVIVEDDGAIRGNVVASSEDQAAAPETDGGSDTEGELEAEAAEIVEEMRDATD